MSKNSETCISVLHDNIVKLCEQTETELAQQVAQLKEEYYQTEVQAQEQPPSRNKDLGNNVTNRNTPNVEKKTRLIASNVAIFYEDFSVILEEILSKQKQESASQNFIYQYLSKMAVINDNDIVVIMNFLKRMEDKPSVGKIFEKFISPKNFMGITILAKELGEEGLRTYCSQYIAKNWDVLLTCSSIKSCKLNFFLSFLESCRENEGKFVLADKKLSLEIGALRKWDKADKEYMKLIEIVLKLSEEYPDLRDVTTGAVNQIFTTDNCPVESEITSFLLLYMAVDDLMQDIGEYSIQTMSESKELATVGKGNAYQKSERHAEDGDVMRPNWILKETVNLPSKDSKHPKLTLENCFEISTDAIQCNDGDRLNEANAYIKQNLETICASDCLKTSDWCAFERFLENPGLEDFTKLQLVEAKLRSNPNDSDEPQYHETDVESVKVAARLSTEFRDKHQALTAHCHTLLKSKLSDLNCIEMAVLAHQWKLDELKIWAQFRVMKNFHSITSKIVTDTYAKQDLIDFLKMTSLPHDFLDHIRRLVKDSGGTVHDVTDMKGDTRVCNTDQSSPELEQHSASGASPIFDQDVLSKKARDWALKELSKLSSRKTKTVGENGGVIELDGCSLTFPEGALQEDTDITMTVNTDPDNCPTTGMPITPVVGVEPSMSFEKPVKVRLQTCFAAERGHRIPAQLSISHGSGWEHLRDVTINSNYEICFDAYHFSDEGITTMQTKDGVLRLQNDIFIHIRTGLITSSFYLFDKDRNDLKKAMRESSCASFCPHPLDVDGKLGELLTLKLELKKPNIALLPDDWVPDDISMREIREKGKMHFNADPDQDVTSLQEGSYISGIYKVFVGSPVKPKARAIVKQQWRPKLDPESKDPPTYITAGKVAMNGGFIKEDIKDSQFVVGGNYHS